MEFLCADMPADMDVQAFRDMREKGRPLRVLDVRQPWEVDICAFEGSLNIPLSALPDRVSRIPGDIPLVVVCHHGVRSKHAVTWLRANGFDNAVNLTGGIDAWARQVDPSMATY